jgi:hypothetical protein
LLIVALQILNLSVYGRDCQQDLKKNTIGELNEIDSLAEYVAEIILDHKNAFPENGPNSHQSHTTHLMKHPGFNIITFRKNTEIKRYCVISPITIPTKEEYKYLFARKIIPPPPKA